jgi:acetyl-CoA carboxylase biotin carboxylase subunit
VIAAAETTGCEAIHPGYGFLSENPAFARACAENDLVFVGPTPEVMERLGDKAAAKDEMRAAGVPLVPGTDGPASLAEVRAAAASSASPCCSRRRRAAAARACGSSRARAARGGVRRARREADAAFGDGSLYLEKVVARPATSRSRCSATPTANVLTLGERECSIQRRHQKLVEESPSPALSPETARGDGGAVERACAPSDTRGPGRSSSSRARGGAVLHRGQLPPPGRASGDGDAHGGRHRARAGPDRGGGAARVSGRAPRRGHAIEIRINAEDPARGFVRRRVSSSASGRRSGPGVRVDTAVEDGTAIPPYYDSLIAKVMSGTTTGPPRSRGAVRALEELEVEGIPTTRDLALDVLARRASRPGSTRPATLTRWSGSCRRCSGHDGGTAR